eukprot:scaffold246654_cov32-Tisochrysis_lutea.AAC.2
MGPGALWKARAFAPSKSRARIAARNCCRAPSGTTGSCAGRVALRPALRLRPLSIARWRSQPASPSSENVGVGNRK